MIRSTLILERYHPKMPRWSMAPHVYLFTMLEHLTTLCQTARKQGYLMTEMTFMRIFNKLIVKCKCIMRALDNKPHICIQTTPVWLSWVFSNITCRKRLESESINWVINIEYLFGFLLLALLGFQ